MSLKKKCTGTQSHRQNLSPRDGHLTATGRLESISFNYTPFHPKTKRIKRKHKKSYVSLPFSKPNKTLEKNTLRRPEIYPWGEPPRCSTGWASQTISPSWDSVELQIYDLRKKAEAHEMKTKLNQPHFVALKKCNNLQVFLKNSASDQWMAENHNCWTYGDQSYYFVANLVPSRELIYSLPKHFWVDDFSFFQGGIF